MPHTVALPDHRFAVCEQVKLALLTQVQNSTNINGEISQSTVGRGWIVGETRHGYGL